MGITELTAYAIWIGAFLLAFTIYLRVDWHDWGMVGLMLFAAGATFLMTRSITWYWGSPYLRGELLVMWRALILTGVVLMTIGQIKGLFRDPPPQRQVVRRLVAAAIGITVLLLIAHAYDGGFS